MIGAAADSTGRGPGGSEERVESPGRGQGLSLDSYAELSLVVTPPGKYLLCVGGPTLCRVALAHHDAELVPAGDVLDLVDFVWVAAVLVKESDSVDLLVATTLSPRRAPKGIDLLLDGNEGHEVESTGQLLDLMADVDRLRQERGAAGHSQAGAGRAPDQDLAAVDGIRLIHIRLHHGRPKAGLLPISTIFFRILLQHRGHALVGTSTTEASMPPATLQAARPVGLHFRIESIVVLLANLALTSTLPSLFTLCSAFHNDLKFENN